MIKIIIVFIVWVFMQLLAYVFPLTPFQMLSFTCIIIIVLWFMEDKVRKDKLQKEYQDLLLEVQSSSNDAHLKYKQMATILSNIPFPILLLDDEGNIVMHNNCLEIEIKVVSNNDTKTYLSNNLVESVQDFVKDAYILEQKSEKIVMVNGIEYMALSVPVMVKHRFMATFLLFQNIAKTLEGEKKQRQFLADASHELKTPISIIKGMLEILNREDFDDVEVQDDFLIQMGNEVERLDIVVKDLLQLSKMSSNDIVLDRRKYDFVTIVQKICKPLMSKLEKKGLILNLRELKHQEVFCDELRFTQAISNLIQNAINYSEKGTITIRNWQESTDFVCEVEDQGCGISASNIPKIFDRFYRINSDRARSSGGSGLGLAIVKQVVVSHGGKVEVKSAEGEGTCFKITMKN